MVRPLFLIPVLVLVCAHLCYPKAESQKSVTTLTGILLASDRRCDELSEGETKNKWTCPEGTSQWGLLTRTKQYSVRGNTTELGQYERRRVTVSGITYPGSESHIDIFDVHSIGPSEMSKGQIRDLIEELRHNPWKEPANIANPTLWVFNFTSPMLEILQAGPRAQDILLRYVDDPQIKDQIIVLLGGVGDQKAVSPIIHAMADSREARTNAYAKKVNLAANLALTNITVSDVIWHHGGGIMVDRCPDDPKSCWQAWWIQNKGTFDVARTASRNFSNYPGYGVYQDPGRFRSQSFR